MSEKAKPKPVASGAYAIDKLETEPVRTLTVLPYDDIVKALNAGKAFVLPTKVNRSTVKQSVKRIAEKVDKNVTFALRTLKDTGQFCYIPVAE